MIEIRKAVFSDIPVVQSLNNKCFSADENYSFQLWSYFFKKGILCVAEESKWFSRKTIVGYVLSIPYTKELTFRQGTTDFINNSLHDSTFNAIGSFAVLPNYRQKGIGRQLLKAIIDHIGNVSIILNVRVSNYKAISLYEKNNFIKHTVVEEDYYEGPRENAYLMYRHPTSI